MIVTHITIVPLPGKREAILEILRHVESTLKGRAGCEECAVSQQSGGEGAILYMDRWLSSQELGRHIQSSLFLRVLLAMELAARAPQVEFLEIAGTEGLPWVEALRARTGWDG